MPADSDTEDKPKPFLGLSGTQTIGSALAAVTSALVGSFLGVAGTLIGAALGSIIATVGGALFTRTLTSATTVALKTIPQRGNRILPADAGDGDVPAAGAPAGSGEPHAARAWRQLTPMTWIKIGAASAAAFLIAMVSITAVEFGTNQPISSLVSSTSRIDDGTTGPTTTLGKALSGNPTAPDKKDEPDQPAQDVEEVPAQVEDGTAEEDGPATDSSSEGGISGSAGTEEPGTDTSSTTPPADPTPGTGQSLEPAPETEQSPEPAPATEQAPEPDVSPDSGSAGQPAP